MKEFLVLLMLCVPVMAIAESVEIDGIYYNLVSETKQAEVIQHPYSYSGQVVIPASVVYQDVDYSVSVIRGCTFFDCSGLTSITIPNSVTSIGDYAFYGCTGLTSIVIPNGITSIDRYAFYGCTGLTSIVIPNSVVSIGSYAFSGCSGLSMIDIPNSVTNIGSETFSGTAWYNTQPNGIIYVGKVVYKYKGTMPNNSSIVIKEGTLCIGGSAFSGCTGLTSITIPNSVTSIGDQAFYRCGRLTSITIPNSVTSIGVGAFAGCSGLTSVTIPNSVTSIGRSAFYNCSITSLTIPNSVTSIGDCAFKNCSGLTSVTIGNSVTSIGEGAFYGCTGLTSITSLATIPPICGNNAFLIGFARFKCTLKVPEASISRYKAADQWKEFFNIEPTGINTPKVDNDGETYQYFDLNGQPLLQPRKGVNIVKSGDGTTRKVVVK